MKVSIIVPIYNVEKYLARCLDSLIHQTLRDIEIVCVEDCSTDGSAAILKRYAEADSRIRVIQHTTNLGLGKAWRDGALAVKGQYVMFCDSDDEMYLNACEELADAMDHRKVDIINFGTEVRYSAPVPEQKKRELSKYLEPPVHCHICGEALLDSLFVKRLFTHNVWNKIYRSEIIKAAYSEFPDICYSVGQDMLSLFLICYFAHSYDSIPNKYYIYNYGDGITTVKALTHRQIEKHALTAVMPPAIKAFLAHHNALETYQESLDNVTMALLHNMVSKVTKSTPLEEQEYAFDTMVKAWGMPAVLGEIQKIHGDGGTGETFIKNLPSFLHFKTSPRKVKRIGTFYYTIRNGGAQRVATMLTELWVKMGYEVILFTDVEPSPDDYPIPNSVKRIVLPNSSSKDFRLADRIAMITQAVQENSIDLFISHGWASPFIMYDMLAVQASGSLFFVHTHSIFTFSLLNNYSNQRFFTLPHIYAQADGVIALSKANELFWRTFNSNVFTVKNPLTFDCASIPANKLEGKTVLWLARISPEKVPLEAMKIMAKVVDQVPEARMLVVGSGFPKVEEEVKARCEELGLTDKVEFCGFQTDVGAYYRQGDVFLCTSKFEGYPLTLAEAESYGLPVVTYDMPYLTILESQKGCMVVDQNDVDSAASCVIKLLQDDELRKRMGREAKENVIEKCTTDFAAMWQEIFESAEKPRGPVDVDPTMQLMVKTMVQAVQIGVVPMLNQARAQATMASAERAAGKPAKMSEKNKLALIKVSRTYRIVSKVIRNESLAIGISSFITSITRILHLQRK